MEAELEDILHQVVSATIVRERFQAAFILMHRLCETEESAYKVYRIARKVLRAHVLERLEKISGCFDDKDFLVTYRDEWQRFCGIVVTLGSLLLSMDNRNASSDLLDHEEFRTLKSMAFSVWQDVLLSKLSRRVISTLLKASDLDRQGKPLFEYNELRIVKEAIVQAGRLTENQIRIYQEYRHAYFVHLEKHYWLNAMKGWAVPDYIQKTKEFIADELPRARLYLGQEDELVPEYVQKFMVANGSDVFTRMIRTATRRQDLSKLRELYGLMRPMRSFGVETMKRAVVNGMPKYIDKVYLEQKVKVGRDPVTHFVNVMITVEKNFEQMLQEAFNDDPSFDDLYPIIYKNAIEQIEGHLKRPSAELVALYFDKILDSGRKGDMEDITRDLDRALTAAKYVSSAHDFQTAYINLLRKRLRRNRWSNIELEKQAVNSLREIRGLDSTSQMLRLLTDVVGSRVINQMFGDFLRRANYSRDFEVIAISAEFWQRGAPPSPLAKLPIEITENLAFFERLYSEYIRRLGSHIEGSRTRVPTDGEIVAGQIANLDSRSASDALRSPDDETAAGGKWRPSRKLTWFHDLAEVEIEAEFTRCGRSYLIKCQAFTAIILLLFEKKACRRIREIKDETKLSPPDVLEALEQLEKTQVLKRCHKKHSDHATHHDLGRMDPSDAMCFALNTDFECEEGVVDLLKSADSEGPRVLEKKPMNPRDEAFYTEALLIRILKKHTVLTHDHLMQLLRARAPKCGNEVDEGHIVKCLTSLSDKLYVKKEGSTYHYIP